MFIPYLTNFMTKQAVTKAMREMFDPIDRLFKEAYAIKPLNADEEEFLRKVREHPNPESFLYYQSPELYENTLQRKNKKYSALKAFY